MGRQRTLLTMLAAAILAIVVGVLPSSAKAHAGHGHGESVPAMSVAPGTAWSHGLAGVIDDLDVYSADEGAAPIARAANDGGAARGGGAACLGLCCCPTGGPGCSAPALIAASASAPVPDPDRIDFAPTASAAPAEALGDRLPKPPRA
ncbi:MAG: hypothetical protein JNK67_27040 [Alphaproteobacteria bacterium]|nr:hypothetical protein [Alphaproteobacteria bacterium]